MQRKGRDGLEVVCDFEHELTGFKFCTEVSLRRETLILRSHLRVL